MPNNIHELEYKQYGKNHMVCVVPVDKNIYKHLAKQVGGKWNSSLKGWNMTDEQKTVFIHLITIVYPGKNTTPKEIKVTDGAVDKDLETEEAIEVKTEDSGNESDMEVKSNDSGVEEEESVDDNTEIKLVSKTRRKKTKYRRENSDDEDDDEPDTDTLKYYKQFKNNQDKFNDFLLDNNNDVELSSSDDENGSLSSSSEDYPNSSPKRQLLANDHTLDKINKIHSIQVKKRKN